MTAVKVIAALALILGLGACSSKFQTYDGPEVTRIVVQKADRRLYLLNGEEVLEEYAIALGFAPTGDKAFEGDGKTPEGRYVIDRRNPDSAFHLSVGISYPDAGDIAAARAVGLDPGGDIFIHGGRRMFGDRRADWTAGCISVSDREIEQIYAMVGNGTVIDIYP